jgi:uncharacterized cupin superfamily protein
MSDKPTSVNADGIYEPFTIDKVPVEEYSRGSRFCVKSQSLGDFGGGTHVGVAIEELAPGRQTYPAHYHMLEEEHLLVLEGSATLRLGERTYELGKGHYVCFPAGQKAGHTLVNRTDKPFRFLIIGERNPNEVVVYTDSGRVGVRALGEGLRRSAKMDYWEGEDVDAKP